MKSKFLFLFLVSCLTGKAQSSIYEDSLLSFQRLYVLNHEVVTGEDKKGMRFYPVSAAYRVPGSVTFQKESPWFLMETSGPLKKTYRVYARVSFVIRDTTVQLDIYQSQSLLQTEQYRDHLFIPFTDATAGWETYTGGRYMDVKIQDIQDGKLVLDFNKAYNPYCAYVSGKYNCPIPPKENRLPVSIRAGEKIFQAH